MLSGAFGDVCEKLHSASWLLVYFPQSAKPFVLSFPFLRLFQMNKYCPDGSSLMPQLLLITPCTSIRWETCIGVVFALMLFKNLFFLWDPGGVFLGAEKQIPGRE